LEVCRISAGSKHSLVQVIDGKVWNMGKNFFSQTKNTHPVLIGTHFPAEKKIVNFKAAKNYSVF
jgi:alpha-tubulin suppressor-like RCC1 family protein